MTVSNVDDTTILFLLKVIMSVVQVDVIRVIKKVKDINSNSDTKKNF